MHNLYYKLIIRFLPVIYLVICACNESVPTSSDVYTYSRDRKASRFSF